MRDVFYYFYFITCLTGPAACMHVFEMRWSQGCSWLACGGMEPVRAEPQAELPAPSPNRLHPPHCAPPATHPPGDRLTGRISREELAGLLVAALGSPAAAQKTFELRRSEALDGAGKSMSGLDNLR